MAHLLLGTIYLWIELQPVPTLSMKELRQDGIHTVQCLAHLMTFIYDIKYQPGVKILLQIAC